MRLFFRPMNGADARELCTWRYPEPYQMYNMTADDLPAQVRFFTEPANAYYTISNEDGTFVAYRCFGADARVPGGDYTADALDTGGGLRPDLTGRGLGRAVLTAGLAFGRQTFAPRVFRVTVAEANVRAMRVIQRAGFVPVQRFASTTDGRPFVVLVRDA